MEQAKKEKALYDFVSEDGIRHRVWKIGDPGMVKAVEEAFEKLPAAYIADGHHRAASAVKAGLKRRKENPDYTGKEPFNYFLSVQVLYHPVIGQDHQLIIWEQNRQKIVKGLFSRVVRVFLPSFKSRLDG